MTSIRTNWTIAEISKIYHTPLLGLVHQASIIHREYHNANTIKISTLISMKTGACVEDCAYCAQSSRYNTHVDAQVLEQDQVIALAKQAQENGVPRICLSASWKEIPINKFDNLLDTISKIRNI